MTYTCTADECAAAMTVAKRRNTFNRGQSNLPKGETATTDARLMQHYAACLSEIGVARLLNLSWSGCGKGSDGRRDVGDYIEVRTNSGKARGLLIRKRDPDAPFVLTTVAADAGTVEILGWEWSSRVLVEGWVLDGHTDKPCWIFDVPQLQRPEGLYAVADEARGTMFDHDEDGSPVAGHRRGAANRDK